VHAVGDRDDHGKTGLLHLNDASETEHHAHLVLLDDTQRQRECDYQQNGDDRDDRDHDIHGGTPPQTFVIELGRYGAIGISIGWVAPRSMLCGSSAGTASMDPLISAMNARNGERVLMSGS